MPLEADCTGQGGGEAAAAEEGEAGEQTEVSETTELAEEASGGASAVVSDPVSDPVSQTVSETAQEAGAGASSEETCLDQPAPPTLPPTGVAQDAGEVGDADSADVGAIALALEPLDSAGAGGADALQGSSDPRLEDVQFTLAERRTRLCPSRSGPQPRPDLSLFAGLGDAACGGFCEGGGAGAGKGKEGRLIETRSLDPTTRSGLKRGREDGIDI